MRNKYNKLALWLMIVLILAAGCQTAASNNNKSELQNDHQTETGTTVAENTGEEMPVVENPNEQPVDLPTEVEDPIASTDFFQQLDRGLVTLNGIQANSMEQDTFGQILTLQLTNPGTEEVMVSVPCGLVFTPSDDSNQRLMSIQPLEMTLAAGETKNPQPFVVCIDVDASAPNFEDTYSVGPLTENPNLLKFAECICDQKLSTELGSMDGVGVQFAAWSIGTGGDFAQVIEGNGAMADMLRQEYGEGLDEAVAQITEMISMFGDEWLEKCEIELEN